MNRFIKMTYIMFLLGIALSFFFIDGIALASSGSYPPTLIPPEDTSIGGYGTACTGLATMIESGKIHLRNIPCFIKYITQTLVGLAGSASVVFVMIGGYKIVVGNEDMKSAGKKTITYALIGLAVSLLAWVLIDIVLQVATE